MAVQRRTRVDGLHVHAWLHCKPSPSTIPLLPQYSGRHLEDRWGIWGWAVLPPHSSTRIFLYEVIFSCPLLSMCENGTWRLRKWQDPCPAKPLRELATLSIAMENIPSSITTSQGEGGRDSCPRLPSSYSSNFDYLVLDLRIGPGFT